MRRSFLLCFLPPQVRRIGDYYEEKVYCIFAAARDSGANDCLRRAARAHAGIQHGFIALRNRPRARRTVGGQKKRLRQNRRDYVP